MASIVHEHRVKLSDGATLFVKLLGDPSSERPLLIALHGAPGLSSHAEPEATFGFLQSKFRVLVYDARGSGVSDLKQPYTHERWIADVEELRVWAGAEKFVLAGGSYGGFVALDYALVHQERLLALILRDTWAWGTRGMMQALKACLSSKRVNVDPDRQYRMWTGILKDDQDFVQGVTEMAVLFTPEFPKAKDIASDQMAGSKQEQEEEQENSPNRPNIHAATQNWAFSQNMPRFDVRSRLKEIQVRTFVAVGRQDLITPVEFSEEIARGIPRAELEIFENSGHNPAMDEREDFQGRLGRFIESLGF